MAGLKNGFTLLKKTFEEFTQDDCPRMAAALAYYTVFSLPPLLVLIIVLAGALWGQEAVQGEIENQIGGLIGPEAATQVQTMIRHASEKMAGSGGLIATLLGIGALLFGATGAFAQLQDALNRAWEVGPDPQAGGIKNFIFKRLLSFGMILGIAFLLILSLAVSTALPIILGSLGLSLPFIDFGVTLVTHIVLFALIYKVLPDAHIRWSDVLVGASMTALLFAIGKFGISRYLAYSSVGSAYGTAGSMVVLLLWVYYSAVIFFFGAELTQAYARVFGRQIVPKSYAVRVESPRAQAQRRAAAGA